jgi:hypothetical protein
MSIPEAACLVIQAAASAVSGSIFMLDMGQPVPIVSLAEKMIRLRGLRVNADIAITFTGLRPGEKLHEELTADLEDTLPTGHAKIMEVVDPRFISRDGIEAAIRVLEALARTSAGHQVSEALRRVSQGAPVEAPALASEPGAAWPDAALSLLPATPRPSRAAWEELGEGSAVARAAQAFAAFSSLPLIRLLPHDDLRAARTRGSQGPAITPAGVPVFRASRGAGVGMPAHGLGPRSSRQGHRPASWTPTALRPTAAGAEHAACDTDTPFTGGTRRSGKRKGAREPPPCLARASPAMLGLPRVHAPLAATDTGIITSATDDRVGISR